MRILLPILFVFFSACEFTGGKSAQVHNAQIFAFGTVVDISHYSNDEKLVQRALEKAQADLDFMHTAWHPYQEGPLARINSLLPLQADFSVAPSVRPLIVRAKEISRLSEGYFNPAIGKLVQLWGFDRMETLQEQKRPDEAVLKAWRENIPGMDDVVLEGITARGKHPDLLLDFGGFAKGFGVDRLIEELRKLGVRDIIVNAGGDLRAIGSKGGKPWKIGIRHPRNNGILASIEIKGDESVFTSGDYERFFEFEGQRYHHILDPFSGEPARDFQSVTVVNQDAAMADAAATALFVAGKANWQRIAAKMGLRQVMLVDQQGKVYVSRALRERLNFPGLSEDVIEVVELP